MHREYDPNEYDPLTGQFLPGSTPWNFKGKYKRSDGYIDVLMPDHPHAHGKKGTRQRYVFEHTLVMEKYLGRYLVPPECVHHKNHIRDDNHLDNLKLCVNNAEHKRQHVLKFPDGEKPCSICKQVKPLDQFPYRKGNPHLTIPRRLYSSWCYECSRLKQRQAAEKKNPHIKHYQIYTDSKPCTKCEETKPLAEFRLLPPIKERMRYSSWCIPCLRFANLIGTRERRAKTKLQQN